MLNIDRPLGNGGARFARAGGLGGLGAGCGAQMAARSGTEAAEPRHRQLTGVREAANAQRVVTFVEQAGEVVRFAVLWRHPLSMTNYLCCCCMNILFQTHVIHIKQIGIIQKIIHNFGTRVRFLLN